MVSQDYLVRQKHNIDIPISFDGVHVYQLVLRTRKLAYLQQFLKNTNNRKVIRIFLDGSTELKRESKSRNINSIGAQIHDNIIHHIRFNTVVEDPNGINLEKVYSELMKYKPTTLYSVELDIETKTGMVLSFGSRKMNIDVVKKRIDKSKDTNDTPLLLKQIYDLETLRYIKANVLGKQLCFILEGVKGQKESTIYKVVE